MIKMVDRFPEAFERFERVVDIGRFDSYRELACAFSHWAGRRWVDSYDQNLALREEARKRGFFDARLPRYFEKPYARQKRQSWRHETVIVRGKSQVRYRDLRTGRFIKKP
jgi:hypothetical protein